MIGKGLREGDLTPKQAVDLVEWAFLDNKQNKPLWGSTAENGTAQNPGEWAARDKYDSRSDIRQWINNLTPTNPKK